MAVAVIALIIFTIVSATSGPSKDSDSYEAGRQAGADIARTVAALSNPTQLSDASIQENCGTTAELAAQHGVYWLKHNAESHLDGRDIDRGNYKRGCVDGVRSALGR
jgi:hypothetical protein